MYRLIACWGLFFFASQAAAFELSEHKAITRRAIDELSICLKDPISKKEIRRLISFNRREDLNLFRKWRRYSHYYDPDKKMLSRRMSVEARVADLEEKLRAGDPALEVLGAVIHYLQDMAAPPHVVPVKHGARDGFESFDGQTFFDEPLGNIDCDTLAEEIELKWSDLLQETIKATVATLSQKLSVVVDGCAAEISWESFFVAKEPGDYGVLTNKFGKEKFTVGSKTYEVQRADYAAYKRGQLLLATAVTKRAIYYYLSGLPSE